MKEEIAATMKELGYKLPIPNWIYDGGTMKCMDSSGEQIASLGLVKHPNCCGVKLAHSLGSTYSLDISVARKKVVFDSMVKALVVACTGNSMIEYVANTTQKEVIRALTDNGFVEVTKNRNPKSQPSPRTIHLFVYHYKNKKD